MVEMSNHNECIWNCGATDCLSPERPINKKRRAISLIKNQPFFKVKYRLNK
jgi:hypothetical protein